MQNVTFLMSCLSKRGGTLYLESGFRVFIAGLEHDPEKWVPVFRIRSCSNKKLELDADLTTTHVALATNFMY